MTASSGSRPELINATNRRLRRMGFADGEAANLTALTYGFGISPQPWTVEKLTHVLFLREMHRLGRRWSGADDRADEPYRTALPTAGDLAPAADTKGMPPVPPRTGLRDGGQLDERVTLFTLMAGQSATLNLRRPPRPPTTGTSDIDRTGG